jgi:peroxiredoxin
VAAHGTEPVERLSVPAKLLYLLLLVMALQARGPEPGQRVPDFRLTDQNGKVQTFESLKGPNGLMLVFYKSADWCAFCKTQLVELEESREQLRRLGLGLAAVSYDSGAVLKHFSERKGIHFPLLSDVDSKIIRKLNLLNEEVPERSPFFGVPHPVTYIIDAGGVVKSRHFEEDDTKRYTANNILTEELNIRTGAVSTTVKNPRITVTSSASNAVIRGGERIRLILDVQLPRRMHVYAPGVEGYVPIEWKLNDSAAIEAMPVTPPASRMLHLPAIKETVPVYENSFTLQREIVIAQGAKLKPLLSGSDLPVEGTFRYQACDDKKCYVPETIPLKWVLRFEPHDSQRVPPELQRK